MISTFAGTTMIQYVLKRRKDKREKIRRISLGIKSNDFGKKNKPKKPDYTTFFGAIACNVLIYAFSNYAISLGAMPQGDMITGFFYRFLEKSFASTIIFAIYIMFIFGLYFGSKLYE